ncbi:MAG TPA: MjaI family restriction endonuclease [Chitinophagaceae bacterium]|nr:MjaI family restriction endonuclease [Chitinophagaceae bacterium]
MAYTGGLLNQLNGKMGISASEKSVPVMKLIRAHEPKSKEELVELIKLHHTTKCKCGIRSQGTVEDFGRNLYNSQLSYWGEYRFSLQECIQWEYDLFVVQSLKGGLMEKKAISELQKAIPQKRFVEADAYIDEEMRVDIVVRSDNQDIAGIQVKPLTFKLMRKEVIDFNRAANNSWTKPVLYLYYDSDEEFVNIPQLVKEILTYSA